MNILQTLEFILNHPLNRSNKMAAFNRWFLWQIGSRLIGKPVVVDFVNQSRLLVSRGMTGATGNIYCGLHEFEDMAFLLHLLRKEDLFVDVGANIGSYTVLASAAVGARSLAFEPLPDTYVKLMDNIRLNNVMHLVKAQQAGVGKAEETLQFTVGLDTINHVADLRESASGSTIQVPVVPLDGALDSGEPLAIKIDVEGFESNVVAGAGRTFARESLKAVIMELNGSGERYGFDERDIHNQMLGYGFLPFSYEPFLRSLVPLTEKNNHSGNTLYLRDIPFIDTRLKSATPFRVLAESI